MILADIITYRDFFDKVRFYTFDTPKKNLHMMRYINKINECFAFYQAEYNKILICYGTEEENGDFIISKERSSEYTEALKKLLDMEVEDLPVFPISELDFETCIIPKDQEKWLSANDFMLLYRLIEHKKSAVIEG